MKGIAARAPLLPGISQFDVDFVIPRAGVDLPVGIDPFLLYKSRDPRLRELHRQLLDAFNAGIDATRRKDIGAARTLLDYPEVSEIGFGYAAGGKRGSGVGPRLTELIVDTLTHSPALQERGVRHVEEMQLVSTGIGPDRVSDIAANILKDFLIRYTQQQCEIWDIPLMAGVPIAHVYNHDGHRWDDGYFDLPISPADQRPILLVPRRIVRALPWINYDDFLRTELRPYLAARRQAARHDVSTRNDDGTPPGVSKTSVVTLTRADIGFVERYVRAKEQSSAEAQPTFEYLDADACLEADRLREALSALSPGREDAATYQRLVLEILNFLFNPDLIDGEPEVRTIDGTERRDIIFVNDSDDTFWDYVRNDHGSFLVMFEAKNVAELDMAALNQTATYLGDRLGRFGVIITRNSVAEGIQRKAISIWNDSGAQRKVILVLSDADIGELLTIRCKGRSPSNRLRDHYRRFRQRAQ